jgi:hypothetical protein
LIAEHKAAEKELYRADEKRDARIEAQKEHGPRPADYVPWRVFAPRSEDGLDKLRRGYLSEPGADHKQIEQEYRDLKPKLIATLTAAAEWDQRTGLTSLSTQYEAAERAWHRAGTRLARTKPTTPAGAGALVSYVHRDIEGGLGGLADWHMPALKTCAAALKRMEAA